MAWISLRFGNTKLHQMLPCSQCSISSHVETGTTRGDHIKDGSLEGGSPAARVEAQRGRGPTADRLESQTLSPRTPASSLASERPALVLLLRPSPAGHQQKRLPGLGSDGGHVDGGPGTTAFNLLCGCSEHASPRSRSGRPATSRSSVVHGHHLCPLDTRSVSPSLGH